MVGVWPPKDILKGAQGVVLISIRLLKGPQGVEGCKNVSFGDVKIILVSWNSFKQRRTRFSNCPR